MPSVIPAALARALADKLYDKQRAATLKVERLVVDALDADDEQRIYALVAELATDYATSEREAARIGGLVALAATAVALTHINIRPFLPHMVPPMVSALSDGESKVRYFACESLYNVAKVSRGSILRWFNDIFDGLARVTADSVKTVKDGADYLDRLVKDIVAEQAATCLDWYEGDRDDADSEPVAAVAAPRLAFSLDKFVPLLSERMHTYKPSTRLYLIEWIRVLDSVPGLDLIVHLPEFLDGLLRFLSDPSDDVRSKTQSLLGELLNEIRECVELQELHSSRSAASDGAPGFAASLSAAASPLAPARSTGSARVRSSTLQSDVHVEGRFAAEPPLFGYRLGDAAQRPASRASSAIGHHLGALADRPQSRGSGMYPGSDGDSPCLADAASRSAVSLMSSALASGQLPGMSDELRMAARRKTIRASRMAASASVPGSGVVIDFARCVGILVPHIESNDQEIQGTALAWIYQFTWLCPQVIVAAVPLLVNAVLPSMSHPMPTHRRSAEDVNEQLYALVRAAPDPAQRRVPVPDPAAPADAAAQPEPLPALPLPEPDSPSAPAPGMRSRTGSLLHAPAGSAAGSAAPSRVASPPPPAASEARRLSAGQPQSPTQPIAAEAAAAPEEALPDAACYEDVIDEPFNYEQAATAVMELFAKNVHEPTKIAGMQWLLLLHRKAPWRILTPEDMSFPVLLKMLGDSSERVVRLDLELFAQISAYSQGGSAYTGAVPAYDVDVREMPYLARFLGSLLQMFATDRVLLETRGALMVRQLCVVLDPQLVFCLFARILLLPRFSADYSTAAAAGSDDDGDVLSEPAGDRMSSYGYDDEDDDDEDELEIVPSEELADLEFISVMVQHLSWILVTAPEAEPLRLTLRRYSSSVPFAAPGLASLRVALHGSRASTTARTSMYSDDSAASRRSRGRGSTLTLPAARPRGASSSASAAGGSLASSLTAAVADAKPSKLQRAPAAAVSNAVAKPAKPRAPAKAGGQRSRGNTVDGSAPRAKGEASKLSAPQAFQARRRGFLGGSSVADRARAALSVGFDSMQRSVQQNRQSHGLFLALFRAWSHNPAALLTLCLLSQHYEISADLVHVFGQLTQDLTVSLLVQLDKLVQLIESPVFTFLRLQLLDPAQYPKLIRTLYGLLMLLPQSSAFAILRNRLSTVAMVPSFTSQSVVPPQPLPANPQPLEDGAQTTAHGMQVHYHYHAGPAPAAPASDAAGPASNALQLCNALGVTPGDVSELARMLAVCSQQQCLQQAGSSPDAADAGQILRELVDLQLVASSSADALGAFDMRGLPSAQNSEQHLLDEYKAVRRRHAQALARH